MTDAVYPGSFDPITFGHLDVIKRGRSIFDQLIVAVAENTDKETVFSKDERVEMIREQIADMDNVTVDRFDGLVVNYLEEKNIKVLLRGIRTVSDFEYEFQMALTNRTFNKEVETLFIMPDEQYSFISSSLIKEAVSLEGDVSDFVPDPIQERLRAKLLDHSSGSTS